MVWSFAFKEELLSNLEAHVINLKSKGLNDSDAFLKASSELGDIITLANQICQKKKQEVYETLYMKTLKNYVTPARRIAYLISSGLFLFVTLVSFMNFQKEEFYMMIPFGTPVIAWIVYLLLTQETSRLNPMRRARAVIYGVVIAILSLGFILFLGPNQESDQAYGALIAFGLPSVLALVNLILTEQSRTKTWVVRQNK